MQLETKGYILVSLIGVVCQIGKGNGFGWEMVPSNLPYFFGYKMEFFFLPKQSQRSRSILQDGSRSLRLFRKGKISITAKFHRTDLVI